LELEAEAPAEAQARITAIAESNGGFVVESNQSSSDVKTTTRDKVSMTIRIPAEKFNQSLDEIRKTATRTISETVKGQDVTEEFIDIEARLKSQKALEAQFLEIMKRSNSVADALSIQREIAEVRGEIEKVEGRKQFLQNQSSFSTLKIKIQSPAAFSANSSGFLYQIGQSFNSGFNAALGFILVLITAVIALLPFLIFVVLPIYLVVRYFLKKNRKQKLAREIAQEEIRRE
jgi:Flp pilus assembly protein TadB